MSSCPSLTYLSLLVQRGKYSRSQQHISHGPNTACEATGSGPHSRKALPMPAATSVPGLQCSELCWGQAIFNFSSPCHQCFSLLPPSLSLSTTWLQLPIGRELLRGWTARSYVLAAVTSLFPLPSSPSYPPPVTLKLQQQGHRFQLLIP